MARLLIRAIDNFHPDYAPEEQHKVSYLTDDVVKIMPDGHVWGLKEQLPNFYHADIVGTIEEVKHLEFTHKGASIMPMSAQRVPKLRHQISVNGRRENLGRRRWKYNQLTSEVESK